MHGIGQTEPMSISIKSAGETPSERYVAKLCDRTFLRLWSYPNLYREPEKELCDILAVFGSNFVVFSDKSCKFDSTKPLELAWERWHRKSILASASQALGARRWLLKHYDKIFFDRKCTKNFPLIADPPKASQIHLVVVAQNIADACQKHCNGRTSLSISATNAPSLPFSINQFRFDGIQVHVFDEISLELVLTELDTAIDFVTYLQKREELLSSERFRHANSEEDLLALYLTHCEDGKHSFGLAPQVNIRDTIWLNYRTSIAYARKKSEDRWSYHWDKLIDLILEDTKIIKRGTPQPSSLLVNETKLSPLHGTELALRVLASESRFARRYLAKALLEFLESSRGTNRRARVVSSIEQQSVMYVFMTFRQRSGQAYEDYCQERAIYLRDYCLSARSQFQDKTRWIGLVSEPAGSAGSSLGLLLFDQPAMDADLLETSKQMRKAMGVLENTDKTRRIEDEYPDGTARIQYSADDLRKARNRRKATRRKAKKH